MNLIQLYPSATLDDLRLYFQNTWIWAKPRGASHHSLHNVLQLEAGNPECIIKLVTEPGASYTAHELSSVDVEIRYPEAGYSNWRSTVVEISRKNRRQGQKGISHSTVGVENPFIRYVDMMEPKFKLLDRYTFPIREAGNFAFNLAELLNGEPFTPITQAWNRTFSPENPIIARAIGRHFALSKGIAKHGFPALWFDGIPLGYLPDAETIKLTEDAGVSFEQEVRDFFEPQGIEVLRP